MKLCIVLILMLSACVSHPQYKTLKHKPNFPRVEILPNSYFRLIEDYKVSTIYGIVVVPKGYKSDLASTPRIFWPLVPPFGRYASAALVHDCLYDKKQFTRCIDDDIFYELMLENRTWKIEAYVMWFGVRTFGWLCW